MKDNQMLFECFVGQSEGLKTAANQKKCVVVISYNSIYDLVYDEKGHFVKDLKTGG